MYTGSSFRRRTVPARAGRSRPRVRRAVHHRRLPDVPAARARVGGQIRVPGRPDRAGQVHRRRHPGRRRGNREELLSCSTRAARTGCTTAARSTATCSARPAAGSRSSTSPRSGSGPWTAGPRSCAPPWSGRRPGARPADDQRGGSTFGVYSASSLPSPTGPRPDTAQSQLFQLAAVNRGVLFGDGGEAAIPTVLTDEVLRETEQRVCQAIDDVAAVL